MKTKLFILISFLLEGKIVYPQATYTMPVTGTQIDTVCEGIFYDSGGPTLNYSNNGNGIMVLCSSLPGHFVMLTFTSINLNDSFDRLRIFSGTDTMGTLLFTLAGSASSTGCGTTFVSFDSSGGCLTVHFSSGGFGNASGWRALLNCNPTISGTLPGTNCLHPVIIPSLPFMDAGQCTECMLNDYQNQGGICNTSYGGQDKVYSYTAAGSESVCINISNTSGFSTLAIYQGCPGMGGVCLTPTPMVGTDSMQFTFPAAGTYYIIIDGPPGFSCYDLDITPCIIGIDEQEKPEDGVLIFPNPASGELRIENAELKIKKVEFYNVVGEKILHHSPKNEIKIVLDTSPLPAGLYLVKVTDEKNHSLTKKIVKM